MKHTLTYLGVSLLLLGSASALAEDVWTGPYAGVRHLHRTDGRNDLHAMVVDLGAAEISFVATRPEDRGLPVGDFARKYGAEIAFNANYFDGGYRPCGMAAGDGVSWGDSYEEQCNASIGLGRLNEALAFDSSEVLRGPFPEPWMTDVVSGKPWLVRDGVVQGGWVAPGHIEGHHPRTAIGLSRDRRTLFVVVADGRQRGARGLDGNELASLLSELGAWDALNLDGGGSSELWVRREGGTQNHPSDGRGRGVGNHLGIRVTRRTSFYAARVRAVTPLREAAPGEHVPLAVTIENVGRAPFPLGADGRGLALEVVATRTSALWDAESWDTSTTPAAIDHVLMPGEVVTLPLVVQAPVAPGVFREHLALVVPGHGLVAGARADIGVRVAPARLAAIVPELVSPVLPRAPAPAPTKQAPAVLAADVLDGVPPLALALFAGLSGVALLFGARGRRTPIVTAQLG